MTHGINLVLYAQAREETMSQKIDPALFWPKIIEAVANGRSLSAALNQDGFPSYAWARLKLRQYPELQRQFDQAMEDRADRLAEELIELTDQKMPDALDASGQSAWVQHQRLKVDTRKWVASKLRPRVYGDRLDVAVTDGRISVLDAIKEARQRVLEDERDHPRVLLDEEKQVVVGRQPIE